jgi:peptidyl-tRNA hydrolase
MTDAPIKTAAEISREYRRGLNRWQIAFLYLFCACAVAFLVVIIGSVNGFFPESYLKTAVKIFPWVVGPIFGGIMVFQTMSIVAEGKALQARDERIAALMARRYKIYTVVSREAMAKMGDEVGKMFAQGGHAALHAWWDSFTRFPLFAKAYRDSQHAFKITLVVDTDAELEALYEAFQPICGVSLVRDAGFTVFKEPTITCLGIGPIADEDRGALADLKTLRPAKSK